MLHADFAEVRNDRRPHCRNCIRGHRHDYYTDIPAHRIYKGQTEMTRAIGMKLGKIHPDIQKVWTVDEYINRRRFFATRASRARILRLARSGNYTVFMAKRYFVIFKKDTAETAA